MVDSATRQSTLESDHRAGDDGHKRRKGSQRPVAVDTRGQLVARHVMPANEQERAHGGARADAVPGATGQTGDLACVAQGDTGQEPAAAQTHGIRREVVKVPAAKRGCVVLPRRWVVERSLAWAALPPSGQRRRTRAGHRGGGMSWRLPA